MTLVEDARQWWRWWSVRLALIAGPIFGAMVDALLQDTRWLGAMAAYAPDHWRPLASALAGVAATALPIAARLIKQGKQNDGNAA